MGRPPSSSIAAGEASPHTRPAFERADTDSTIVGNTAQEALQFSLTAPSDSGSAIRHDFDSRPSTANSGNHLHPLFVPSSANFLSPTANHPSLSEHSPSLDTLTRSFPLPNSSSGYLDPLSTAAGVQAGYTGPEGSPRAYQFPPPRPLGSNNPFRASIDASSTHTGYRHSLNASSPTGSNPFELDFNTTEPNLEFDFTASSSNRASINQLGKIDTKSASLVASAGSTAMKREKMMSGFSYYNPTTPVTPMPRKGSHASSVYSADAHANGKHDSHGPPQPWQPLQTRQRATSAASGRSRQSVSWADDFQPSPIDNTARLSNIYDAYSGRAL